MADVKLISQEAMNHVISHEEGVKQAVRARARGIGSKAKAIRLQHFFEGQAQIEVTFGDVDALVSLVDPNALSIEFGHDNKLTGNYTHGLYILSRAAGLV